MKKYYVNKNAQYNGDHEVHHGDCIYLPTVNNRKYLGEFSLCYQAVMEAKKTYPSADGCRICSLECHRR